ncbi:MAG: helix-turn-helix domain-containing protein [Patescibacteria group bacterium]
MTVTTNMYQKPEDALEKIGGKWKMPILWRLSEQKVWRYSQLKRDLDPISHKMLSQQLKELEADGFINRKLYAVVPPKVEYSLTDKGSMALPAIKALCKFSAELKEVENQVR